ncbi:helix-turn-helix transcriptional regulator [Paraburkholderia sp. FT54]|uniref:helix-turn-helix domain-containing protein n=1 Tax=Paraburkholderia sp. FT54 TaxID=3074437 RepID=UPI002877C522|nr:helix-turn-helix transcriptional regulator [Paraburkholderia sp. FT54]WNC90205.1 helix-turn-helix transcriptional regulator [Paraburkholderia sp. FT54]
MLLPHMAAHTSERQNAARKRLAKNLKLFRGNQSMSQEALADRAGMHRTQLSQIERGLANASIDSLVALAEALGVEEAVLLMEQAEEPTPLKVGRKKTQALTPAKKAPRKTG